MAQCMRDQGMDVADPEEGGGVQIQGRGKKMSKKKVDDAMAACRKFAPQGLDKGADPKAMDNMREYAKCMRENGVEEFPDPQGGGMRLDAKVAEDPDVPAADKKCKPKMGKGGGGLLGGGSADGRGHGHGRGPGAGTGTGTDTRTGTGGAGVAPATADGGSEPCSARAGVRPGPGAPSGPAGPAGGGWPSRWSY